MNATEIPRIDDLPAWLSKYPMAAVALGYASVAHAKQTRKYTNEPYIHHCFDVMVRLRSLFHSCGVEVPDAMMAAAVLHDTVEDTDVTFQDLTETFGIDVAGLVFWLTDVCPHEWGNRATRKRLESEKLLHAPRAAQIIKFCDIISNTISIEQYDPGFAKTYVPEKMRMLEIIGDITLADLLEVSAYQAVR